MESQDNKIKNMEAIKDLLNAGLKISVISVLESVGTIELRHYIAILRKEMRIADKWVKSPDGKRYKEYWIKKAG